MAFFTFEKEQLLLSNIDEVWDFISSPKNLQVITPRSMGFEIVSKNLPEKMYPGMIIIYNVKPLFGIKMTWVSEITQVVEKKFFIDVQQAGPYAFWHHQHLLEEHKDGVMMRDIVSYRPPFGIIGNIANSLIIRRKLDSIFEFRTKFLEGRFNKKY